MSEAIPNKIKEQMDEMAEATRKGRIRAHASDLLKSWVAMTPGATPQFVEDQAPAVLFEIAQRAKRASLVAVARVPPNGDQPGPISVCPVFREAFFLVQFNNFAEELAGNTYVFPGVEHVGLCQSRLVTLIIRPQHIACPLVDSYLK